MCLLTTCVGVTDMGVTEHFQILRSKHIHKVGVLQASEVDSVNEPSKKWHLLLFIMNICDGTLVLVVRIGCGNCIKILLYEISPLGNIQILTFNCYHNN